MNANRWYIRVYIWYLLHENVSSQTLYSRNNARSCVPPFLPQSLAVCSTRTLVMQREREREREREIGTEREREIGTERERREWRRTRNHNLFHWWDKGRLNQFTARDLKIRQDGPVCFFVCTYAFHIKYHHIIPC